MYRLERRYDNVKVPESPGKSQNTGKRGQRGDIARVGDQCLSDLGQWSHYLSSVGGDPPGNLCDLQIQESSLPEKVRLGEELAAQGVALGLGSQFFRSRANQPFLAQR